MWYIVYDNMSYYSHVLGGLSREWWDDGQGPVLLKYKDYKLILGEELH